MHAEIDVNCTSGVFNNAIGCFIISLMLKLKMFGFQIVGFLVKTRHSEFSLILDNYDIVKLRHVTVEILAIASFVYLANHSL